MDSPHTGAWRPTPGSARAIRALLQRSCTATSADGAMTSPSSLQNRAELLFRKTVVGSPPFDHPRSRVLASHALSLIFRVISRPSSRLPCNSAVGRDGTGLDVERDLCPWPS